MFIDTIRMKRDILAAKALLERWEAEFHSDIEQDGPSEQNDRRQAILAATLAWLESLR
jgi:hypothetical protein